MQKIIEAATKHAGAITPVPDGVRQKITVCLLRNTLVAAARRRGVTSKKI
jgi:methylenetetrahydrofolate dehydrogenase (NADP+) / methenyltetrahydrofolate cyclohydrolase